MALPVVYARDRYSTELEPRVWREKKQGYTTWIDRAWTLTKQDDACFDTHNQPSVDHELLSRKITRDRLLFSTWNQNPGKWSKGVTKKPVAVQAPGLDEGRMPGVDVSGIATKHAARTNPGRTEVSLPTFISELKDFPLMIREIGRAALRRKSSLENPGNFYLTEKFGIEPMLGDLNKMIDFANALENRLAELRAMQANGGLTRKRKYGIQTKEGSTSTAALESVHGYLTGYHKWASSTETWASCRWKPHGNFSELSEAHLRSRANDYIKGLTFSGLTETAWELTPWSWLVDYFANIGDFLQAQNNSVAFLAGPVNVMVKRLYGSWTVISPSYQNTYKYDGQNRYDSVEKYRFLRYPTFLPSRLPILSGGQMKILGALAVARVDPATRKLLARG